MSINSGTNEQEIKRDEKVLGLQKIREKSLDKVSVPYWLHVIRRDKNKGITVWNG